MRGAAKCGIMPETLDRLGAPPTERQRHRRRRRRREVVRAAARFFAAALAPRQERDQNPPSSNNRERTGQFVRAGISAMLNLTQQQFETFERQAFEAMLQRVERAVRQSLGPRALAVSGIDVHR